MGICSRKGGGRARWENKIKIPLLPKKTPLLLLQRGTGCFCNAADISQGRGSGCLKLLWQFGREEGLNCYALGCSLGTRGWGAFVTVLMGVRGWDVPARFPPPWVQELGSVGLFLCEGGRAITLPLWEPLVSRCSPPAFPEIVLASGNLQTKSSINRETKASEDSSQDVLLNGRCCRHLFQLREKWGETYPKYFNKRQLAEQPSLAGDQFYALGEKKTRNL